MQSMARYGTMTSPMESTTAGCLVTNTTDSGFEPLDIGPQPGTSSDCAASTQGIGTYTFDIPHMETGHELTIQVTHAMEQPPDTDGSIASEVIIPANAGDDIVGDLIPLESILNTLEISLVHQETQREDLPPMLSPTMRDASIQCSLPVPPAPAPIGPQMDLGLVTHLQLGDELSLPDFLDKI